MYANTQQRALVFETLCVVYFFCASYSVRLSYPSYLCTWLRGVDLVNSFFFVDPCRDALNATLCAAVV